MQLTYYGHACFAVNTGDANLLFDPFISSNELAKAIDVNKINCDYVLISHGHEDHLADAEDILKRTKATVVSNYEIAMWYVAKGIENYHPMNFGGTWKFDFGKVKFVKAEHSSVMPDGTYGGNPGGFIVKTATGNFYYAGDTSLHYDMKLIGEYEKIDFAVLPIGDNFTMGIDDAIRAAEFIKCNKIVGVHYDTFPYIKINKEEAIKKFAAAGKELILLSIGETKTISI
ncbi:MAG: metal-dependent hydrolase [Flavobacteriales bacterium]|nr:metal-dependent hydrolase [Flavobacteriales bacterium]